MKTKPDNYYRQSAVLPYRIIDDRVQVLLITSLKRKRWIIPKGIVEESLTPQDSAAKEALEEAGVKGVVSDHPLGHYEYQKWGGTCRVEVFPMRVDSQLDHWSESDFRTREWVTLEIAADRVEEEKLKEIFYRLPSVVKL